MKRFWLMSILLAFQLCAAVFIEVTNQRTRAKTAAAEAFAKNVEARQEKVLRQLAITKAACEHPESVRPVVYAR